MNQIKIEKNFISIQNIVLIFHRRMKKSSISNFIQKTWEILHEPQYSHILDWSRDGCSFVIKNQTLFSSQVLPRYFKHSNFSSFIRQLNMYNFHKIKKPQNSMEFHHRLFRKNKRELLIGIKRKPSQAEIEFGESLIRKMNMQSVKSIEGEVSMEDDNTPVGTPPEIRDNIHYEMTDQYQKRNIFDSPPTFYLPMWMGYGMPLLQINPQNNENNGQDLHGHKILTNIIIKTPPNAWTQ